MTQPPEDPFAPMTPSPPSPEWQQPPPGTPPYGGPPYGAPPYGGSPYGAPPYGAPPPPGQPWPQQDPWGQPQWQQPWGAPRRTNTLAILSLVFAFLCSPVGIVLGIIALVQLRSRQEDGRGLAIGGLVTSSVFSAGAVLVVALAIAFGESYYTSQGQVSQVGSTVVGACLTGPGDDGVSRLVDCSEEHEEEVYAVQRLDDDAWPGSDDLDARADDFCHDEFSGYVGTGYFDSEFDYGWYQPDRAEWSVGERRIVCVVTGHVDAGEGSVQGSER